MALEWKEGVQRNHWKAECGDFVLYVSKGEVGSTYEVYRSGGGLVTRGWEDRFEDAKTLAELAAQLRTNMKFACEEHVGHFVALEMGRFPSWKAGVTVIVGQNVDKCGACGGPGDFAVGKVQSVVT